MRDTAECTLIPINMDCSTITKLIHLSLHHVGQISKSGLLWPTCSAPVKINFADSAACSPWKPYPRTKHEADQKNGC